MEFTIRYPGHCDMIRKMINRGEFSDEIVTSNNRKITRKEKTCEELFEAWKLDEGEEEFTFMLILATTREGDDISYTIYDDFTEGWSSMARTTGLTACAFSRLILERKIKDRGIICPETLGKNHVYYNYVLDYLKVKGISIQTY